MSTLLSLSEAAGRRVDLRVVLQICFTPVVSPSPRGSFTDSKLREVLENLSEGK